MRLGIKEIQEIIPHRHPFLLIDFIDELEPVIEDTFGFRTANLLMEGVASVRR